jgi:hypothetical protein
MNSDLRLLREFGDALKPLSGPPDELRRRVLARAARPAARQPTRLLVTYRSWRLTALGAAAAAALAVAVLVLPDGIGRGPDLVAKPTVSQARTSTQVLRLAADHVALVPQLPARADQFVFIESVATFSEVDRSGWLRTVRSGVLVSEWRSVDGSRAGLIRQRPVDRPDAPWHSEPIVGCPTGHGTPNTCQPGSGTGLPTDGDLMYDFLYRTANDDISATYAAPTGDDLAFERAARTLYLAQHSPPVQAAVFTAMNRIPGITVLGDVADLTGRRGVALARRGPLGTTELIFDPDTYRYLGRNLTVESTQHDRPADNWPPLMTRQAVQRVAIVDHVGDLP